MASTSGKLYTTLADMKSYLPSDYADVSELADDTLLTQDIHDASREIDTRLRRQYSAFPATTETPDTPEDIQTMAKVLSAELARLRSGRTEGRIIDENGHTPLMKKVYAQLKDLNENVTHLGDSGSPRQMAYMPEIGSA